MAWMKGSLNVAMATPLQPREFFRGVWRGEGELIPHPLLRLIIPRERFRMTSAATWLSDTIWFVEDRFEFASGRVLRRKMFAELVAADRIHVTADDMPLGADILLHEEGFQFTPYYALGSQRDGGRIYQLRCTDECRLDAEGFLHDSIQMYYLGFPVAAMRIGPIDLHAGRDGSSPPAPTRPAVQAGEPIRP